MSDDEDHMYENDLIDQDDEQELEQSRPKKTKHRRPAEEEEEEEEEEEQERDDDEEEDDDEDEEDEEEEEAQSGKKSKKRAKHRHKRSAVTRFLDIEAEVSEDEDEDEEEEDLGGDFIENVDDVDDDTTRRHHALLDSRRVFDEEERSPEEIARAIAGRHRDRAVPYTGDMNEIPQRLLMPSVHDASLWQVRVKPGRERDIVLSLLRKAIDVEYSARPLSILSAFQRDSLPGMIYVEARSAKQVQEACQGLVGVYPSRGVVLVPIEEMATLLQIKKVEVAITPGTWVRIRRGKYAGDLAQVVDVAENGEEVGLRLIPRIDMNPKDEASQDALNKKRKKPVAAPGNARPPQRLFNFEEIVKVYGRKNVSARNNVHLFQNDTYKDGFLEKDMKINNLILDDINPTLDEITQFTRRQDGTEDSSINLSGIAEASRKAAVAVLQPGDHVEVFEGEQAGIHGVVEEVSQDVVTITAEGLDIDGQKMEIPARSVRKRFKAGDHVKVMAGQNSGETGLVVAVAENVVTFISDMTMQEISVFSKDLREAAEVGSGTNTVGNYELHDLVQLDAQTVGVIFKTERDSFRVLDQHGNVRLVQPHQITMRRDSNRAIATDHENHEIRQNDNMKEAEGEGRRGRVLHTHQSFFAFLHNRDITENGGVFVTKARNLVSLAPKSNAIKKTAGMDLSKMNPALVAPTGGMVGSGNMGRGPRDRSIGETVTVVKGPNKGYVGTIRDTNGNMARVELRTGNKLITIEKEKLRRRTADGKLEPLDTPRHGGMGPPTPWGARQNNGPNGPNRNANPYNSNGPPGSGGYNPANGGGGPPPPSWSSRATPNPYAQDSFGGGGKTPAWNASSRTPNPYASAGGEGGKTPAWNASSRTPNPYAAGAGGGDGAGAAGGGGRTPAWNVSSRTPNPYAASPAGAGQGAGWGQSGAGAGGGGASAWGGATPGRHVAAGWQTPGRNAGGAGAANGWQTPGRQAASWDQTWSAPTPAAAPTPGIHAGPTPGPYGAPTPGPTGHSGMGMSAPTPGFWAHAASAATPGGPGAAATPWPAGNDDVWGGPSSSTTRGGGGRGGAGGAGMGAGGGELDDNWLLNPSLHGYLKRLKVVVEGTVHTQYLNGEYEGRTGRVVSAQVAPEGFTNEQCALVKFVGGGAGRDGEERMVVVRYLKPVQGPRMGEEVVVLPGPTGAQGAVTLSVVREPPEDDKMPMVVSSKMHPTDLQNVPQHLVVPLWDE